MSNCVTDWETIRRRLDEIGALIEKGFEPGPEEKKRILKRRAETLALAQEEEPEGEYIEIVEFMLANERYCIESRFVREVCAMKDYTPLPGAPPFVLGLTNIRGRIVSVVDMGKFFDLPGKGLSDLNKVIVIRRDSMEFGVLADSILTVRKISLDEIGPPLPTLAGVRAELLQGVTKEGVAVLDAGALLSGRDIVVHEEV
jgi:purine-binding chemotaxis protein CheW